MTNTAKTFVKEIRRDIEDAGTSDWIDVYHRVKTESDSFVVFGAIVAESAVRKELQNAEWGPDLRGLVPACTEYSQGRVQYDVHGNDQGYQPIVQEFQTEEMVTVSMGNVNGCEIIAALGDPV